MYGSGIVFHVKSWSGYELCCLLTPLLTCFHCGQYAGMAMFIGSWELGVWFSALHEIPYFIMMKLLFLLPCDFFFFFFEVKFNLCVCGVLPIGVSPCITFHASLNS